VWLANPRGFAMAVRLFRAVTEHVKILWDFDILNKKEQKKGSDKKIVRTVFF